MTAMGEVWRLLHDERVVADLEVVDAGFPWLTAIVHPRVGFEAVAPLFSEELRLLDDLADEETPEWTAAYHAIREQTSLRDPLGNAVAEYLLHIDGAEAWWRWEDEPFPEDDAKP